jgi:hypothetical protein
MQTDMAVVRPRAKWHDVKALVKKVTEVDEEDIFVQRFDWGNDIGWLVTIYAEDADLCLELLKSKVLYVVICGYNVVFVKVSM